MGTCSGLRPTTYRFIFTTSRKVAPTAASACRRSPMTGADTVQRELALMDHAVPAVMPRYGRRSRARLLRIARPQAVAETPGARKPTSYSCRSREAFVGPLGRTAAVHQEGG